MICVIVFFNLLIRIIFLDLFNNSEVKGVVLVCVLRVDNWEYSENSINDYLKMNVIMFF